MKKATFTERIFIDRYRCIDRVKSINYISSFVSGGLTYFKIDSFNYEVVETAFILSMED